MIRSKLTKISLVLALLFGTVSAAYAEEFNIAVASHFAMTIQELVRFFEKDTGHKAVITENAAWTLYTKLKEGAPFDIFLSADVEIPAKLEQEGLGIASTRFTYAIGKLVLWSAKADLVDKTGEVLKKGNFAHLAIFDPEQAPYGAVAKQTLERLGVWTTLQPKLIIIERPLETRQRIIAGEAELGFLPLSLLNPSKKIEGSLWIVPASLYAKLEHQTILLKHGENNKAAKDFLAYLRSPRGRNIIETFGYSLPK